MDACEKLGKHSSLRTGAEANFDLCHDSHKDEKICSRVERGTTTAFKHQYAATASAHMFPGNIVLLAPLSKPVMTLNIGGLRGTADFFGVDNGTLESNAEGVEISDDIENEYEGVPIIDALVGKRARTFGVSTAESSRFSKICAIDFSTSKGSSTAGT